METMFPLEAMQLSPNARTVLTKRYLTPGETPEERAYAVARHVASAEVKLFKPGFTKSRAYEVQDAWTKVFYEMMVRCEFSPNSPTWRNAGAGNDGVLSACFVIPVTDSMEGILNGRAQAAYVQKSGGGTGFDFSLLRPEGAPIKTTQGSACGPVRVIKDYDFQSYTFTQGDGSFRLGANMGILRIDHPDIEKFIDMKLDGSTKNFNISVAVTQEFMDCLNGRSRYQKEWEQCHINVPVADRCSCQQIVFDSPVQYTPTIGNHVSKLRHASGYGTRWIDSRVLWDKITKAAYDSGDPGVYFPERAELFNPTPKLGTLNSTNPCGEVPLLAYEPCNLGSINVARFVPQGAFEIIGDQIELGHAFNLSRLRIVVRSAVRFLDDVVEVNVWPTPEIAAAAMRTRKIGLGIMGWADSLAELQVPYDSHRAVDLAWDLMQFINDEATKMSEELADERGRFPAYDSDVMAIPRRNATVTCIAPTGTISIITDCSSGIEPPFRLTWNREMEDGTILPEQYKGYANWVKSQISFRMDGTPFAKVPDYLKGANDIHWTWHLRHQQAFQGNTHLAVSKTINLPEDAKVDDVDGTYRMAWSMGLKGTTIYRHNSKSKQVLTEKESHGTNATITNSDLQPEQLVPSVSRNADERFPDDFVSSGHRFRIGETNGYIQLGYYPDGRPGALFLTGAKMGSTVQGLLSMVAVTASAALQGGVPLDELTHKWKGMKFEPSGITGDKEIRMTSSVADYIGRKLDSMAGLGSREMDANLEEVAPGEYQLKKEYRKNGDFCPECLNELSYGEGCVLCLACGYTHCG